MNAVNLKTEYLRDPMGIDVERPRLFWNCQHGRRQTAFQVVCKDGKGKPLWDSGKREGDSMRVRYGGSPLKSRQCVLWQVRIWDEAGKAGPWSETAAFEMGLLRREDWSARWITGDYRPRKKRRYPVDLFRREIPVDQGLVSARLYITACGLYEARCNGTKAGMFCLAPGLTDYRRRVQYQTYDVTRLLHPGANELTVQLADGWYRGSVGAWGIRNAYGTETKFLAQLELEYGDGSRCVVGSDGAWQWSNDGPLRFADNKDGEVVEAWRVPSYRGKARVTKHPVIPCASNNVPVTEHERFTPDISVAPNGKLLLDFHQNIAGYLDFQVNAHKGDRLFFRFGELLDKDGNLTLDNIQCKKKNGTATPLQQIEYRCKEGLNRYKTTFAVFGFQYAEVETELPLSPEDVKVVAVYSDLEETGKFACSDPLLERFYEITKWSTKGNSLDIPTDCPTRERHPLVLAVNFADPKFQVEVCFVSSHKRLDIAGARLRELPGVRRVFTSNLAARADPDCLLVDYDRYLNGDPMVADNAGLMLLKLLARCGARQAVLAGFDGFLGRGYYSRRSFGRGRPRAGSWPAGPPRWRRCRSSPPAGKSRPWGGRGPGAAAGSCAARSGCPGWKRRSSGSPPRG